MSLLSTILLIVLVLLLVGALPNWPHAQPWAGYGYFPVGGLGLVLIVVLILALAGRL